MLVSQLYLLNTCCVPGTILDAEDADKELSQPYFQRSIRIQWTFVGHYSLSPFTSSRLSVPHLSCLREFLSHFWSRAINRLHSILIVIRFKDGRAWCQEAGGLCDSLECRHEKHLRGDLSQKPHFPGGEIERTRE